MIYQLDRKMFTEFVLTWKNAMLSKRGYTIVYPAGPQMCTKLCRKKGFDVLVIMNLFRETASPWKRKKNPSWQGDCLWDRGETWGRVWEVTA